MFCFLDELQVVLNLLVLVVKGFALADLLETMLQWPNEQVIFSIGMGAQQSLCQRRQASYFRQRFLLRDRSLNMIEHVVEDHMLGK